MSEAARFSQFVAPLHAALAGAARRPYPAKQILTSGRQCSRLGSLRYELAHRAGL
jgi:hypothetical protein